MSTGEFVAVPEAGRVFRLESVIGLADVSPSRRARLDAIARCLQDVAVADFDNSGVEGAGVWVARRMRMRVERFPQMAERLVAQTFCSGAGPLCAERRTRIEGDAGALVEAATLWVHLDATGSHPRPLPDGFLDVYGPTIQGRRVRARLRHPAEPPPKATARRWQFRRADLDPAGHVNNTVHWSALEEVLDEPELQAPFDAEIEYRAPADAGEATILSAATTHWIIGPDREVLATMSTDPAGVAQSVRAAES